MQHPERQGCVVAGRPGERLVVVHGLHVARRALVANQVGAGQRADDERRFTERDGQRHIDARNPRQMEVPSTSGLVAAVAINVLQYVVWFLAFWLGLRFTIGHSLGLAVAFGVASMVILMPLLFEQNKVKPVVVDPQPTPAAPK